MRASLRRWGLGLLLGILAGAVNLWEVRILTEETPIFLFGGVFVLVAFVGLGLGPGIVAALISLAHTFLGDLHPAIGIGSLVYVLEGIAAYYLYRRTRSLPLSVAAFWFAGGWIWDLLVYRVWVGLSLGYIALLFVKQLLNGMLNALGAELVLRRGVERYLAGLRGAAPEPVPIQAYAFQRIVLLIMVPLTLLGLFYVQSRYEQVVRDVRVENRRIAWSVVTEVDTYLDVRREALREAARTLQRPSITDDAVRSRLEDLGDRFSELAVVAVVDSTGVVRHAHPSLTVTGDSLAGLDVADRDYFRQVRETGRSFWGRLIIGRRQVRPTEEPPPTVVLAEPLFGPELRFSGALVASLDPGSVADRLGLAGAGHGAAISLVDASGRVITSRLTGRPAGVPLDSIVRGPGGVPLEPFPLADRTRPASLSYFPPPSASPESGLAVNLIHGSYQPVLRSGWGVLVETPAERLYPRFLPVAYQVVGLLALVLLLVSLVVRRFSAVLAHPLKEAARTARRITAGDLQGLKSPARLRNSVLREATDLGRSLERMRKALAAKERETLERQRTLEAQLLQAQKMEAIGLLAGGVAHDFNNLLTPVAGFAELGRTEAESEEIRGYFEEIREAAARARDVVQQLLAFSRKQMLSMRVLDLGDEVRRAEKLLRPLLREDIELEFRVGQGERRVTADPSQIQQILVNLAVNAQDAMPAGGRFVLEVRTVKSGPPGLAEEELDGRALVELRVTDTGQGIPEEAIPQIFDPFFTTKGPGEGTGLGLATVYGIVRQHGGAVRVDSSEDGTTFHVYLPRTDLPADAPGEDDEAGPVEGGHERVLLVEDDEAVRHFVGKVLEQSGYRVVTASSGEEALEIHASGVGFDVLVTDVVLEGMNGSDLYGMLARERPRLEAVFMSGYSHDTLGERGPPPGTELLSKPFDPHDIVAAVRRALDR